MLVASGADLGARIEGIGTALDYARLGKAEGNRPQMPFDGVITLLEEAGAPSVRE